MSVRVNVQLVRYSCSEAVRTPLERARGRLRASGEALRDCRSEVNHFIACALTVHALICRFRPIHCACRGSHTPKWTTVSLNSRPSSAAIHKTCHAPQNTRTLYTDWSNNNFFHTIIPESRVQLYLSLNLAKKPPPSQGFLHISRGLYTT